jgi:hypothetical protein
VLRKVDPGAMGALMPRQGGLLPQQLRRQICANITATCPLALPVSVMMPEA